MAAEKTFSRINAGESMAFPGRLTRCAQHPRAKGAPTIAGKIMFLDTGGPQACMDLFTVGFRMGCRDLCHGRHYLLGWHAASPF